MPTIIIRDKIVVVKKYPERHILGFDVLAEAAKIAHDEKKDVVLVGNFHVLEGPQKAADASGIVLISV